MSFSKTNKDTVDCLIQWIRNWFEENGKDCYAVLGISGGKDSTVVAKLLVEALGKDRVIGVLMPNGDQKDIEDSRWVCNLLDIKSFTYNIKSIEEAFENVVKVDELDNTDQARLNLPPRIRMSMLYYIAQKVGGRVVNTSNLSESLVGWGTRWGDTVGDISPLGRLTKTEVVKIGDILGLPFELVHKTPSDGLTDKSDEDNLGFTYDQLDSLMDPDIDGEEQMDKDVFERIKSRMASTVFKRLPIPTFDPIDHEIDC